MLSGNSVKLDPAFTPTVRATSALIKFCEDHEGDWKTAQLRVLLAALDADDRDAALRAFKSIAFGGMGTFPDWIPPAKFENETPDYVCVVFEALTVKWYKAATDLLRIKKHN